MDFIFSFILELILDDGIKVSKSKKISKPLRIIILSIILLIYISIIGLITILGINKQVLNTTKHFLYILSSLLLHSIKGLDTKDIINIQIDIIK